MFVNGDVEGELEDTVTKPRNIVSPPDMDWSLKETLEWAVDVILNEMEKHDTQ